MNLNTTIDLDIKSFFIWWSQELAFLVPKKVKQLISDKTGDLVFTADVEGFVLSYQPQDALAKTVFEQKVAGREVYQQLLTQYPEIAKADIILRLNDAHAMAKLVYLPEAALENLQQVVGFELDRYTPFQTDQVYYSAVPLGKTGFGQIQVLLVLTPQVILDDLLNSLLSWDIQPSRVEFQNLQTLYPQTTGLYNLLPARFQPESNVWAKSVHWILNGLLLILFMAVLIFPVWQEKVAVDTLKTEIKALEKDTRQVDAQQLEIDSQLEETQKLIDIKLQTPELVLLLNELTHLFKDDSWLTNMQYSDKHMQIQGQSPAASSLIGVLEASPYFSKVSFVSPLTQDKTTGLERFQISLDVVDKEPADPGAVESSPPAAVANEQPKLLPRIENKP